MKFTKMQGIGNDYVYVNCFSEQVKDPETTAKLVSNRHFGIGSDGLILIKPSQVADCQMDMYNLDGSRGAMCGNGIRCVGKYVYDHGIVNKTTITVETPSGIKTLDLQVKDQKVERVTVDMGCAAITSQVPERLTVFGRDYDFIGVSMGNPHAVLFVPDVDTLPLGELGPGFEGHSRFPDRTNTEFVQVISRDHIKMRVWERGSGETLACGTGACASLVASVLAGHTEPTARVELLGGSLTICWDRENNRVMMTGTATQVFEGEIDMTQYNR